MNWEMALKFFGGTTILGLLGLLLKYFVVSAPITFAARRSDAATLIADLQMRIGRLEMQVQELTYAITHTARERDALFVRHDVVRESLLLAAQMHQDAEKPALAMIRQWRNSPDSRAIVNAAADETRDLLDGESSAPPPDGAS